MNDAKWWLVSYDVRDPKRLRKCAKIMEGYGQRVQYSVFRCWMSKREMERLRWELTEVLKPEDDVVLIPLSPECVAGITALRTMDRPDWPDVPPRHLIV
jgi:CRISPR-associated protein Cas2